MRRIITSNMVHNAVTLLKTSPDGTRANEQARNNAIVVLLAYATNLESFLNLKPSSRIREPLLEKIQEYKELANRGQKA